LSYASLENDEYFFGLVGCPQTREGLTPATTLTALVIDPTSVQRRSCTSVAEISSLIL